jgi:hypothetical protein
MAESTTLGAKQVATRIGTDAKTFRKFMRSHQAGVGQGRRYDFPEADIPELAKAFSKWRGDSKAPRVTTPRAAAAPAAKKQTRRVEPKMVEEAEQPGHSVKPMTLHGSGASLVISHEPIVAEPTPEDLDELDDELLELDDEVELDELDDLELEDEEED